MSDYRINDKLFRRMKFENYYITNNGDIAIIHFTKSGDLKKFLLLKHDVAKSGYHRIEILNKKYLVHRLVFEYFGNEPLDGNMVIDHIDRNPNNNSINNLRQVTQKENIGFAIEHGNFGKGRTRRVEVFDSINNTTKIYDSVRDFYDDIEAPAYFSSINHLSKRSEYKRYHVKKLIEH